MINLYNQDCMQAMTGFADNEFDLAIVDPPYGINIGNMYMGAGNKPKHSRKKSRGFKNKDWDKKAPSIFYFNELKRISINQIIWGGNYFPLGACYGFCIWDKGSPEGMSFSDCEFAWHSFKKVAKIYKYSTYKESNKIHPTQKPVKLYEWLLMNYAKEGDKILDTHLGSGSIAIACHNLGYDLTGYEIDTEYYEAATKRLRQHQSQIRMF